MFNPPDNTTGQNNANTGRGHLVPCLLIAAVFISLLAVSWHKWGDLYIDTSRELWVPLQLMHGKALYKDIYYFHGPLPAYSIALLYKLFGVQLSTLTGAGILTAALTCFFIYRIACLFVNEMTSAVIVAHFCFACVFGVDSYAGIHNYIFPYSYAATFFSLFTAAALYYFLRYLGNERRIHLVLWGIFVTLSLLSRPEIALTTWIVFVLSGLLIKSNGKKALYILLCLPLVLSALAYFSVLCYLQGFGGLYEALFGSMSYAAKGSDPFHLAVAGLDNIPGNSLAIIKSLAYHALVVAGTWVGVRLLGKTGSKGAKPIMLLSGGITIVITLASACMLMGDSDTQYRCIPVILAASLVPSAAGMWRNEDYKSNHQLVTLYLVALALLVRIFLKATITPYGFYLLNIGLIGYYIFWQKTISYLNNKYSPTRTDKTPHILLLLAFIGIVTTSWANNAYVSYVDKTVRFDSGKGIIYCHNDAITGGYIDAVDYLQRFATKDESLVVFPEGASINVYTDMPSPLKYYHFYPQDLAKIGENHIIDLLYQHNVTYIAVLHNYLSFGTTYGLNLYPWIRDHYDTAALTGIPDGFFIEIFKKRSVKNAPLRN